MDFLFKSSLLKTNPLLREEVWKIVGNVNQVIEPFASKNWFFLSRKNYSLQDEKLESVNDIYGLIPNFWRALYFDPDRLIYQIESLLKNSVSLFDIELSKFVSKLEGNLYFFELSLAARWFLESLFWLEDNPEEIFKGFVDYYGLFSKITVRLRKTRITSNDWRKSLGKAIIFSKTPTLIFFDLIDRKEEDLEDAKNWIRQNENDNRLVIVVLKEGRETLGENWIHIPLEDNTGIHIKKTCPS